MKRIDLSNRLRYVFLVAVCMLFGLDVMADVVVVRNQSDILPVSFSEKERYGLVVVGEEADCYFADYATRYLAMPVVAASDGHDKKRIERFAENFTTLICAVFSSDKWAVQMLSSIGSKKHIIGCFFIDDKEISHFAKVKGLNAIVAGGSDDEMDQVETAEIIFGGMAAKARLPEAISGIAGKGSGVSYPKVRLGYTGPVYGLDEKSMTLKIDSIAKRCIKEKAFPGCQIVVIKDGQVVYDEAFGTLDFSKDAREVNRQTLFDVASMTKATATLSGLMAAYDDGLFKIDKPASEYLPRLRDSDKQSLTVRDFLFHTTGMPAVVNTYSLMMDNDSYSGNLFQSLKTGPNTIKVDKGLYGNKNAVLRSELFSDHRSADTPVEIAPGLFGGDKMKKEMSDAIYNRKLGSKKYNYSCLNFCILKDMEEALTGVDHDKWVNKRVFGPIGANLSMYRPSDHNVDMNNIAPTEQDNFMRKSHLKGFVHDEMAAFLGGVSGNAGLFSTAGDIAKLCQTWLNGGQYGGKQIFKDSTVKTFTTETSKSARGLGFDKPSRLKWTQEVGMSGAAYGHTGFTGTCFWVDPKYNLAVVILTNRVNPTRDNPNFSRLNPRGAILKAVFRSLYNEPEPDDEQDADDEEL